MKELSHGKGRQRRPDGSLWILVAWCVAFHPSPLLGQFLEVINVPPDTVSHLLPETQLNLFDGASISLSSSRNAEINIYGGVLRFADSLANSRVNVFGGSIVEYVHARDQSRMAMTGGSVGLADLRNNLTSIINRYSPINSS